jgi:ABC-type transport system involved in cytochrome c biogenesis permease subunit
MKKKIGLALWACWLLGASALPAAPSPLEPFRRLVVLEQGRKKPMDTFARNLLKQFSGRSTLDGRDAAAWLARVLFTPQATLDDKIFLIDQPDVLSGLGLEGEGRGRNSFSELRPGLDKLHQMAFQYGDRGTGGSGGVESEFMRLFYNISAYYGLLDAFSFAKPGEAEIRDPRSAPALPAVLPLSAREDAEWLSPAQAYARGSALPAPLQRELSLLSRAARAYGDNWAEFGQALDEFDRSVRGRLGPEAVASGTISLEIMYNRLDPFARAELAYGLALLLLLLALLFQRPLLERLSALFIILGLLAHSFGLVARMLIMGRPPVTNLYETFIFVAWTAVIMGLAMVWLQKQPLGLLAGGLAGLVCLVIAGRYAMDGDTMGMLAAVLDSNLWLATHVVTIALGYAGCVVAGVIGHVVIVQELLRRGSAAVAATARSLVAVLGFGLVFTSVGTLMGGIWADQSWGRFWGWDPKENGALLIIIWLAVLFHARLAGWIGHVGLAVGGIGATIAVVLAWFGVNLLGVGLHAYGFTSGAARGLLAFTFSELVFIAVALPLVRKRKPV